MYTFKYFISQYSSITTYLSMPTNFSLKTFLKKPKLHAILQSMTKKYPNKINRPDIAQSSSRWVGRLSATSRWQGWHSATFFPFSMEGKFCQFLLYGKTNLGKRFITFFPSIFFFLLVFSCNKFFVT